MSAIVLARKGQSVLLLEQNSKVGKKILVSGNGKCNISNKNISPQRFYSSNPPFVDEVLKGYSFEKVEAFFASIGLILIEGKEGKMFPMSLQASSVVELLVYEAQKQGVQIFCDCEVTDIQKIKDTFVLETSQGRKESLSLVLASGSVAFPQLGGSSVGYSMAEKLGHSLITPYPSLVTLCSDEKWVERVAGVKVAGLAKLYANGQYITEKKGDILFTKYGISGLAILDISREVSLRLAEYEYCELSLDLMPQWSKEKLITLLLKHINTQSDKPIALYLQGFLHKKLIPIILKHSKSKIQRESQLNRKEINKLVHTIKNLKLSISDTKGFTSAEVATGGIDTREVNAQNMESKKIKNLFFAGEILDVDGDRGGFNFHFAWVCGLRVGEGKETI
ncbi:NAD(FAD)-utilizing dehydrogenases [hydrothermal vent metagenome]|uniref:NAD(FAD)-utilizing dehydrogenases n=1 Tax=hydrothermal vent metagenome TaxID=652676 RepID=A0A1W1CKE7_9ZZZZ